VRRVRQGVAVSVLTVRRQSKGPRSLTAAVFILCVLHTAGAVTTHPTFTERQDEAVQTTNNVFQEQPRMVLVIWERWAVVIGASQTLALIITFCVMIYVAIRQLRAYVSVTLNFMGSSDSTTLPYAGYEIKNCGATPARDVFTNVHIAAFDYPAPKDFGFPAILDKPQPRTSIFPGAAVTGNGAAVKSFTNAEISAIVAGTKRIYVYGITRYKDMFGIGRVTRFGATIKADATTLASLTSNYGPSDLKVQFEHVSELNDAA
jgi:hypothetical protein